MHRSLTALLAALLALALPAVLGAQENYEIQVYGSETMAPGRTMFELHSNWTATGRRVAADGLLPTNHAVHETVEITHGFTGWSELGVYLFTSAAPGQGWQVVGSHLRPRVRAPESWALPVGLSLSAEFGYQRRDFSEDTWSMELRPIIDKQLGRWYGSLNPTVERAFHGAGTSAGFELSPNAALTYDATSKVNVGVEYYGALGSTRGGLDALGDQEHVLYGVVNLDFGPDWEFNAGYGQGLTHAGDRRVVKLILGRRTGKAR
jgi:hypothetical protein